MAGISWPEGAFNRTSFLISNGTNASSGGVLGADLQHSNGADFLISNGTDFLISNGTNASSGGVLGADFLISNGTNASSGGVLGAEFLISNVTNASSGGVLGADLQHSLFAAAYSAVLALGLAGNALSLSLLSCRARPLSRSPVLLLLQLALLDALLLPVLPLHVHSQLRGDTWAFGDTACRASRALFSLHTQLSVAFLSCLGADLWLAALHPLASLRLRAPHYALVATGLWLVALAGAVPPALQGTGERGCLGGSPGRWAHPTAPLAVLELVFGVFVPLSLAGVALPVLAGSVWHRGRRRRRALGTISVALGICALCFLPHILTQLLGGLPGLQGIPQIQRVTEVLASCSCCLKPLLYRCHCGAWRCPLGPRLRLRLRLRLRPRPKGVFTICDRHFGDPAWDCDPGQRRGKGNPQGWNPLMHSRYTPS